MASSYPPPPSTTGAGSTSPTVAQAPTQSNLLSQVPASPTEAQQQALIHHQQSAADLQQVATQQHHQHYLDTNEAAAAAAAAAAVAAAAQHGLQALEAANGLPSPSAISTPVIPQFSPPSDATYLSAPLNGVTHGDGIADHGLGVGSLAQGTKPTHKRLSKACDLCSQRKVKCDGQHPCRPCTELKVPCSYNRETKRRGPPNRHAEAARKKVKISEAAPQTAAEALMSISSQNIEGLDAEMIAPWGILALLIEDYFTYIYPLVPFPHEPSFRVKFNQREDRKSREFLALVASMVGALAASFPRTVRQHLKSQHSMAQFPRAIVMVEKCREVALHARGDLFMAKSAFTVDDSAASYLLGLAAGYTMKGLLCIRFFSESLTIVRELGYDKPQHVRFDIVAQRGEAIDYVEEEIGRRIFYVLFLGVRSMNQLGVPNTPLMRSPITTDPYPEWPTAMDDQYITPEGYTSQPEGSPSLLVGFNKGIEIYETMQSLVNVDLLYGEDVGFQDQKAMIKEVLFLVKHIMTTLPAELTLDLDAAPSLAPPAPIGLEERDLTYYPPAWPNHQPASDIRHTFATNPEQRRPLQFEIQKANIYTSYLATRSWYVERYFDLRDKYLADLPVRRDQAEEKARKAQDLVDAAVAEISVLAEAGGGDQKPVTSPEQLEELKQAASRARDEATAFDVELALANRGNDDPDLIEMTHEREQIVRDLLKVVTAVAQRSMEPNGTSIISKIRSVAGTLYNKNPERKGPRAQDLDPQLLRFFDILKALEKSGSLTGGVPNMGLGSPAMSMSVHDEEEELLAWASLRDEQVRYLNEGGWAAV